MGRRCIWALFLALLALVVLGEGDLAEARLAGEWREEFLPLVRDLAREGAGDEAHRLLGVLVALGLAEEDVKQGEEWIERYGNRERPDQGSRKALRLVKRLRKALDVLADDLSALPDGPRRAAATLLVGIDGNFAQAREALGHVRVDGRWRTTEELRWAESHTEFRKAIAAARATDIPIRPLTPGPVIAKVTGEKVSTCAWGPIEMYGSHDSAVLARILREAIRATAVANWLIAGRADVVEPVPMRFFALRSRREYLDLLDKGVRTGWFGPELKRQSQNLACTWFMLAGKGTVLAYGQTEADIEAVLLNFILWQFCFEGHEGAATGYEFQACLYAGIVNLTCLSYLGTCMPTGTWIDWAKDRTTRAEVMEEQDRFQIHLPEAGYRGHRRRIVHLLRIGRDPPWAATMLDQYGKIQGDERIKATCMVEYLSLFGELLPLCLKTLPAKIPKGTSAPAACAAALGTSLAEVEAGFRRWLLSEREPSLVESLTGRVAPTWTVPSDTRRAVSALNRVRTEAGLAETGADEVLCQGANLHAAYLVQHPERFQRWPDAHMECPDDEDFSAAGAFAGLNSVISPGTREPEEAVEGWMGTFYHRLPLLEPALLLVGWGMEGGVAVLDARSLVGRPDDFVTVVWPPDGAHDVPRAFQPELPNPVPGEDQSAWGYPVTLQTWAPSNRDTIEAQRVNMSLHRGRADGPEVPCRLIGPDTSANPDIAPANAWCLIPLRTLGVRTTYTVVAEITTPRRQTKTWSFKTGGR